MSVGTKIKFIFFRKRKNEKKTCSPEAQSAFDGYLSEMLYCNYKFKLKQEDENEEEEGSLCLWLM